MRKFSKGIALALVLVMLACSFTGCLTYTRGLSLLTIVDIVFLPISLLALLIYVIINDASGEMESQTYLANAGDSAFTEYFSLMDKIYSLPEEELASLKAVVNSIPEAERVSSIEKITSLTETERASLVSAYNSLPETEIISSLERITSLSGTERVSLLQKFNALSEKELASLIEQLKSLRETDYIATVGYPQEKTYMELSFQY